MDVNRILADVITAEAYLNKVASLRTEDLYAAAA